METDITIKPSAIFALLKVLPLFFGCLITLYLAYLLYTGLLVCSMIILLFALYRYACIRKTIYIITPGILQFTRGLFFRRTDTVELFRVKDYVLMRPFLFRLFSLMNVELKTTDPENPVIWLRGIPYSDLINTLRERILAARRQNGIIELG